MTHVIESQYLMLPLAGKVEPVERGRTAPHDVWLGETAPEEFLREVVDTLAGFLRDEARARELNPGEAPPER
jgi:hypothetical protein